MTAEYNIINLIQNFTAAHDSFLKPLSRRFKMPQTSVEILLSLANNPELQTAKDVVNYRFLKANIVSFNVEKLVSEGYLVRESIIGDRRKVRLKVTEKAAPIIEHGNRIRDEFMTAIFEGLTTEDIDRLKYYHTVIHNNLSNVTTLIQSENNH